MSGLQKESSFPSVASTSQEGQEEDPSLSSNKTLRVTLLSSEWGSSKGGLSTINRELAIQLAKHPSVKVSVYLPQCSKEDKKVAKTKYDVQLVEAKRRPGYEPIDWLASVPEDHAMDCVIGHGVHLGKQIQIIKQHHDCRWIQVVHTAPEELGMYKCYTDAISKNEKKHQTVVELCEMADQVVAVGPKLTDAFSRYLRSCEKHQEVLNLTPGIFTEFSEVKQATKERETFCVLVFGRGDSEDFKLKGYDIAAQAIAELNEKCEKPYKLLFVGAPVGKADEVTDKLVQSGISRDQLTVRCFNESREWLAKLLCEVDLAIMPSRTEGFGLTALEALSAGLPILVSGNSGLGEALKKISGGYYHIVDSEDPKEWAKVIRNVRQMNRRLRLEEAHFLRKDYAVEYSWEEQCNCLVKTMLHLTFGSQQCIITISCDSGWTGIPDVRYDEAGTASGDGGGGGDDDEDGISFFKLFSGSEITLEKDDEQSSKTSLLYSFRFKSGEHDVAECRAVLQNGQLYVEVPPGEIPPGGKECFISLLEYAEEHLDCTHVFVGLLKDRQNRASLMRTFMFMGFETVKPGHELCPNNSHYIFMAYTIE